MKKHRHVTSFQIITAGFVAAIGLGAVFLMMPFASANGEWTNPMDAVFTATSAVCVTGLSVVDTATHWSFWGQLIILILIQTGGMGVVTAAVVLTSISGRKVGLMQKNTLMEAIAVPSIGGIVKMSGFIFKAALIMEAAGAAALFQVFIKDMDATRALWYAVFHSVSSFCNAGFDLMGTDGESFSLMRYSDSILLNVTVMTLITAGGAGFLTWEDIRSKKLNFRKYRMQTKVILIMSAVLVMVTALYLLVFEYTGGNLKERVLKSAFQSVTTRTAGFCTADFARMSQVSLLFMIVLMSIGGSPGSTAGGMKTTTAAVLIFSAVSVFRRKSYTEMFGRRIPAGTERNAATVLMVYLVMIVGGGAAIGFIEDVPVLYALFETASAAGTVGLTLGMTAGVTNASKLILMVLMFLGRVGSMTFIFAVVPGQRVGGSSFPQEKITVG